MEAWPGEREEGSGVHGLSLTWVCSALKFGHKINHHHPRG